VCSKQQTTCKNKILLKKQTTQKQQSVDPGPG